MRAESSWKVGVGELVMLGGLVAVSNLQIAFVPFVGKGFRAFALTGVAISPVKHSHFAAWWLKLILSAIVGKICFMKRSPNKSEREITSTKP